MINEVWVMVVVVSLIWLVLMGYGIATLSRPGTSLERRTLWCPSLEQEADVEFISREGAEPEVNRCSLLREFAEITCGRRCLEAFKAA